ncbi:hypothetical protein [Thalassolituus hydrocarboniclasticus]|uniref:Uncharacterized protein n=1 Tax=Thalassolituus hydrocarboniclasticus TaxID=2742796 RepID=A0ABY6ADP2_9GAMM|nr:hypothetical protein [Thalassolituus hydrocarboniclasticus]UXD89181.1 hypothetical protein HUF19_17850 [Thalassolituus hydrocarboniclasticus]
MEEKEKAHNYAQRIRMVHVLERLNNNYVESAVPDMLRKLSIGYSCPSILGEFRHSLDDESKQIKGDELTSHLNRSALKGAASDLEDALACSSITFPKNDDRHPYSFQQMHLALSKTLPLFQQLLFLPAPEELIVSCAIKHIPVTREPTLPTEDEVFQQIESSVLGEFERISANLWANPRSNKIHEHFTEQVEFYLSDTSLDIRMDRAYLTSVSNFGEFEAFIDALSAGIQAELYKTGKVSQFHRIRGKRSKVTLTSRDVLNTMASWQEKNSMGIVKRLDQCPSIIAAILSFDLEHRVGLFDDHLGSNGGKNDVLRSIGLNDTTSRLGKIKIIEKLIRSFLCGKPAVASFSIRTTPGAVYENHEPELNRMMENWIIKDNDRPEEKNRYKTITELYKKRSSYLLIEAKPPRPGQENERKTQRRQFISPKKRVYEQIEKRKNTPGTKLPVGSELAMPFWSAFDPNEAIIDPLQGPGATHSKENSA